MRRLPVKVLDLEEAMGFRPDDGGEPETPYLDLQTGRIVWVWESDEDFAAVTNEDAEVNRRNREALETEGDRYAEIPEFDSGDDREMLRDFLSSDWTQDKGLLAEADGAYSGSVGRWRRAISHEPAILHAWRDFERDVLSRGALAFLAEHGIEPIDGGTTVGGSG